MTVEASAPRLSTNIRGALWMLAATTSFAVMILCVRALSAYMHTFEILFWRTFIPVLLVLPHVLGKRRAKLTLPKAKLPLYGIRTMFAYTGSLIWFYAIAMVTVSDAVALQFTSPLFVVLLAIPVFGERPDFARWLAIIVGFLGALVIIRPGLTVINPGSLLVLLSSAFFAATMISIKALSHTEPVPAMVFYGNLFMLPLAFVPTLFVWTTPSWGEVPWILVLGLSSALGLTFMSRAFAKTDTGFVMPFNFLRLPVIAGLGYYFFAEVPDVWTWVGTAIIAGATIFVAQREARAGGKPSIGG